MLVTVIASPGKKQKVEMKDPITVLNGDEGQILLQWDQLEW